MDTVEIKQYLSKIDMSIESNVYAANRLPIHVHTPMYIISNLDVDTKPGSHWVAIHIDGNGFGEYFDSFGRAPQTYHRSYLKTNARMWNYNTNRIQNDFTTVCGEYCVMYIYYKYHGKSMYDFLKLFDDNTICNDITVDELFNTIFNK